MLIESLAMPSNLYSFSHLKYVYHIEAKEKYYRIKFL